MLSILQRVLPGEIIMSGSTDVAYTGIAGKCTAFAAAPRRWRGSERAAERLMAAGAECGTDAVERLAPPTTPTVATAVPRNAAMAAHHAATHRSLRIALLEAPAGG